MRCPDCNKFVSFDDSNDPEIDCQMDGGTISGQIRIFLTCDQCGTELKEATFDVDVEVTSDIEGYPDDAEITAEELTGESATITQRTQTKGTKTLKDGTTKEVEWKSRYWKNFYGVAADFSYSITVKDGTGEEKTFTGEALFSDEIPAGSMDELT